MLNLFYIFLILKFSILFLYIATKSYLGWYFDYMKERNVKGPQPRLLKGTFPKTFAGQCNFMEELHEIYMKYKNKERFVGIFTSRKPKLFILDPKLALQILTTNFKNFHDNESSQWTNSKLEELRPCSPFVAKGNEWKERRAELVPALTGNKVKAFYPVLKECAEKLCEYLDKRNLEPLDAKDLANRFTTEFIANFIWGFQTETFTESKTCQIYEMAKDLIKQSLRCVNYYGRTAAFPLLRRIKPMRFFPKQCDEFFKHLAQEACKIRSTQSQQRGDVINHLLQLKMKKSLNEIQIAGHTTTVLIDGFETGAILIAHCLLLLARNERVQQKLKKEIRTCGKDLSFDEMNELPYLEQCLQETLRIFPPLPTLFKICSYPVVLHNHNGQPLFVPKDGVVYISSYSFHRDPDIFQDPETFHPERFNEELGGVNKYKELGAFLPFGDGPRICPGMKLGLAEAKVAIYRILSKFSIQLSERTRKDNKIAANSFLLTLDGGIELIFQKD